MPEAPNMINIVVNLVLLGHHQCDIEVDQERRLQGGVRNSV
jgi:hypothetical protein